MSTATTAPSESIAKSFADFLESTPPNAQTEVPDLFVREGDLPWPLNGPDIQLHCNSEFCGGIRIFRRDSEKSYCSAGLNYKFLSYVCRNCGQGAKAYALAVILTKRDRSGHVLKLGEMPVFGPNVPARVITLIGPDRDEFLLGRRAESLGLGIGAFAYYRRVVENQKGRILEEILRVAKRLNASPDRLKLFEQATEETQFTKAVDIVGPAIPESLLINGQNPLTLLHTPLSKGLHELSEQQCLQMATDIRVVLTELADRITRALQDKRELDDAVTRLLNREAKTQESK